MKIGFLINYFYPYKGGAEDNCFYLARELAKKHEIHIFTSLLPKTKKYGVIDKIHIHRYNTLFRYKYYLSFTPELLNAILNAKLDILHVHSFGFLYHDLIVLLKKITSKTKIINTPHGPFMALPHYNILARIFRFKIRLIEKFFNKNYDAVIQVNPYQYKWLIKSGINKNKIYFIPNGITKNAFKKVNTKNFINKYKLKNKFIISYLGRIQNYKGLDQIINILPYFYENIIFLVMGKDAGDLLRLKKLTNKLNINNRIIFTGEISNDDVFAALKISKIFIMPSQWEAFGISILQAMAQGNAIISTKTEGGKFLIKDRENGFLFNYDNLDELREKLDLLIKNNKLRNKISKNNIKKAKKFLWDNIVKDLEKLYISLLSK